MKEEQKQQSSISDDEIQKLAEEYQKECHKVVTAVLTQTDKVSYEDATNVWIFRKLAELSIQQGYSLKDVEDAFDAGKDYACDIDDFPNKEDYINSIKK